jgi:toxin-antitoxin system PIN domain toxin
VILVDVNLLVYAHVPSLPEHGRARKWLEEKLSGSAPVGIPWESLVGFTRLLSNPRVFQKALPVGAAWKRAAALLEPEAVWIPLPTERHEGVLSDLLGTRGLGARHVPDAHLAALAIEHGLTLCSTDGDFARFEGLRWTNPLA